MIKLFDEFDPVTKDQWLEKASADLKGENPFDKYHKVFGNNIVQYPYYDASDISTGVSSNISHLLTVRPFDAWYNTEKIIVINEKEANLLALNALASGANGILFINKSNNTNLKTLLNNIELAYCYCSFKGFKKSDIIDFLKQDNDLSANSTLNVSIIEDSPIHKKAHPEALGIKGFLLKDISLSINDTDLTSLPKSIARQMSFFVDIICNSNVDKVQTFFDRVIIENLCVDHYFFEIAKIRAIRILFAEIGAHFDIKAPKIFIQSETCGGDDHLENLLINTTQAMSAILGGTDSLIITPHIHNAEDKRKSGFSSRIARNVSNLLNEESHFDKVKDPSAGSYYINSLTEKIVEETWKKFTEMEELGGFSKLNERIA